MTEPNGDDITDQESDQELDDLAKLAGYENAEDARNDLDNT
jgi:hypothetical protein